MDKKEIFDRIEYVVACVGAFAQRYNLSNSQAYAYLRRFTGIEFLLDCYAAEHTLSIDDAVSDPSSNLPTISFSTSNLKLRPAKLHRRKQYVGYIETFSLYEK